MGSLSLAEILVILLVILVVFGPRRLPELSRRAGEVLAKLREGTSYITQAIDSDYGEAIEPIRELKREIDGLKGDVSRAVSSISDLDVPKEKPRSVPPVEGTDTGEERTGPSDP
jgi:TatA/E family protein of Tat protein translocase